MLEYAPSAEGAENSSWRESLTEKASLVDVVDCAQASQLFNLSNYITRASEIDVLQKAVGRASGIMGCAIDKAMIDASDAVKAKLARTYAEGMLVRLFCPDSLAKFSAEERDMRVRAVKKQMVAYAKFTSIFKPVHVRSVEAMKLK